MQESFDYSAYARQVRKVSTDLMCFSQKLTDISAFMCLLTAAMEQDLMRFRGSRHDSRIACTKGCGTCCILNVSVLVPEAVAITRYIRKWFSDSQIEELKKRLSSLHINTRWLDDEERIFVREPCAFLDQKNACMIHAVRPLLCRAITSTDPKMCDDAIAMAALDDVAKIEMNLFQKKLVETVYCALAEALDDLGLDNGPKRLTSIVKELLSEPDLIDSYLLGESIPAN